LAFESSINLLKGQGNLRITLNGNGLIPLLLLGKDDFWRKFDD